MGNRQEKLTEERTLNLVSNSHLRIREVRKLHKKFSKVSSGKKTLTRSQFVCLYHSIYQHYNVNLLADHVFRVFAKRIQNAMDFEEFVRCVSITTRGTLSEQVEWIFQLYDVSGNQQVTIEDIVDILKAANIDDYDDSDLADIFDRMDNNKKGFLSYEEFSNGSLNNLTFLKLIGMQRRHERRGSTLSLSSVRNFIL